MSQFRDRIRTPAPEDGEKLAKVKLLAPVRDVKDLVGLPCGEAVIERGEIGRGVVRRPIALLDDCRIWPPSFLVLDQKRILLLRQRTIGENADGAFAFRGDAALAQFFDDGFEARIVKALAERDIEAHAQPPVDGIELRLGEADHLVPDREILRIAGLQHDQFLAGALERGRVFFAASGDQLVDPLHFRERIGLEGWRD